MTLLLTTLGVVGALMVALWVVSVLVRDASIVDLFWGPGFAVTAWTSHLLTPDPTPRAWLVAILVTLWALRLAAHLARRNLGQGEDSRYRAMRRHHGDRFPLVSLGTVFLLQAGLMWVVSLPLQAVHLRGTEIPLGVLDWLGVALWGVGLTFETVADLQLARFRRTPGQSGQVLERGLWRYSRHPNYFGEFLVWWGFGLIALAAGAWWALVGPAVMTVLLLKVSGVTLLESTIVDRRPGYRDYIARTSAFLPWPPRGGR
jgi:steroid 5-alpha reductase family enzyme